MSLIRTVFILGAAVMLLPVEEKKQVEFAKTATLTAEQTASFCQRNPSTCETGRDLWSLFLRKAEYGMELGARLVRDQFIRSMSESREPAQPPQPLQQPVQAGPVAPGQPGQPSRMEPAAIAPVRQEAAPQRRAAYPMDNPSRWR